MPEDEKPEDEKPARRPRATKPKAEGEICSQCWPKGWRATATNASCSHGNYKR